MADTGNSIQPGGIGLNEAVKQLMTPVEPVEDILPAIEDTAEDAVDVAEDVAIEEGDEDAEEGELDTDDESEDSDEEESADEYEQPDEDIYTVKVDGAEVEVTLTDLMAGYSRQEDYTRKTQELSEQRKSLETSTQSVQQERAQYAQLLPVLMAQIEADAEQAPDWDTLFEQDPVQASRLKHQWDTRQGALSERKQAILSEQQRLQEQSQIEATQAFTAHMQEQSARIPEVIPEWRDANRAKEETAAIRTWAIDSGLSEEMIDSVDNAEVVNLMRKAWLYDKGKARVNKKRTKPSKTMKPGAVSRTGQKASKASKQSKRLASTGSVRDGAAMIESLLS